MQHRLTVARELTAEIVKVLVTMWWLPEAAQGCGCCLICHWGEDKNNHLVIFYLLKVESLLEKQPGNAWRKGQCPPQRFRGHGGTLLMEQLYEWKLICLGWAAGPPYCMSPTQQIDSGLSVSPDPSKKGRNTNSECLQTGAGFCWALMRNAINSVLQRAL